MIQFQDCSRVVRRIIGFSMLIALPLQAQGGKEFLQWLQQYSPTGYFIINDYETRANKPGDHKQWLDAGATAPMPAVAVHETCHMRDGLNSQGSTESFYVGDRKDYQVTPNFTPFNSKEIMPDIPASLENFQTDVYISGKAGTNAYSMVGGLIGIMGEYDAYITGLKSGVEMAACFKANFNTTQNWNALGNDMTTSVWSNSEFRYFMLRYILWAKKNHADIYTKITTGQQWRECYTLLVQFAEKTITEWKAALAAQRMDTLTDNGFDWYWKFWNEIQKQEYKDVEKLMIVPSAAAPYFAKLGTPSLLYGSNVTVGIFDFRGRMVHSARFHAPDAEAYRLFWADMSRRFNRDSHVLRMSDGKDVLTRKLGALPSLLPPKH